MIEGMILAALAALLAFVVQDDLRSYRIQNNAVLALMVLYLASVALTGNYREASAHAAFAAFITVILLVFYQKGAMGGGDVKLLAVAFLWLGLENAFVFSLFLLGFTLGYAALSKLGLLPRKLVASRPKIPFAPCIAAAWLLAAILPFAAAAAIG